MIITFISNIDHKPLFVKRKLAIVGLVALFHRSVQAAQTEPERCWLIRFAEVDFPRDSRYL
jgi:hypothetical protein